MWWDARDRRSDQQKTHIARTLLPRDWNLLLVVCGLRRILTMKWSSVHRKRGAEMSVETAEDLFVEELKDLYSAEKQIVRALPKVAKAVESEELRAGIEQHLEETKGHVERLERIFEILGQRAAGKTCKGAQGLIEEGSEHISEIEKGPVRDAALIGALQRVEHYEIAAYGTVATFAEAMGQDEIHELLGETLQEEKDTDAKLTEVSHGVNSEAISQAEEADEEMEAEFVDEERPIAKKSASRTGKAAKRGRTRAA
jgi:ferritin-like metal-binding protein YciE